jgi:hypothetical protein
MLHREYATEINEFGNAAQQTGIPQLELPENNKYIQLLITSVLYSSGKMSTLVTKLYPYNTYLHCRITGRLYCWLFLPSGCGIPFPFALILALLKRIIFVKLTFQSPDASKGSFIHHRKSLLMRPVTLTLSSAIYNRKQQKKAFL